MLKNKLRAVKRNDSELLYKYSIITPAYNVEDYIEETVSSVFEQEWSKNNHGSVQMIVVNDGSSDGTWSRLEMLLDKFQHLVIIDKENTGVSDTRNIGAEYAKGQYWNFLDSDDRLEGEVFDQIETIRRENPELRLIKMYRRYFEKNTGTPEYYMRDLKTSGIIDTEKDPFHPIIHMASIFFDSQLWESNMFPTHLTYGEDAWVAGILIEKSPKIFFSFEVIYGYRRRYSEDSLVDQHKGNPKKYIEQARDFYIEYFKYISKRFGFISKHVQSMVLYYLSWNIKSKDDYDFLTTEYKEEYFPLLSQTLKYCEDYIILGQTRLLNYYLRHTLLILKYTSNIPENNLFYNTQIQTINGTETPVIIDYAKNRIERWDLRKARIIVLKALNNKISILGTINTIFDIKMGSNFKLYFENSLGNRFYFEKEFPTPYKSYWFMNQPLKRLVSFSDNIPLDFFNTDGTVKLVGEYLVDGEWYATNFSLDFTGHFSWIVNNTNGSYFECGDKLISYNQKNKLLMIQKKTILNVLKKEIHVAQSLIKRKTKEKKTKIFKQLVWRQIANGLKCIKKYRGITINCYMDRNNSAWDNGTALILEHNRIISQENIKKTKNYFVLEKKSKSFKELKYKGVKVIPFGSLRHKCLMLSMDRLISSQANITNVNPFREIWTNKLNDKQNFEFIFLQHGVNLRSLASVKDPWLTRTKLGIDQIVATNEVEYKYLKNLENGSEILPDSVKLTGMARHDLLNIQTEKKRENKKILVMPTWRKNLSMWRNNSYQYNPSFKYSNHYLVWNSLLNDERLIDKLGKYNATLIFAPHPLEIIQIEDYNLKNVDIVIDKVNNYNELINDTDICITDFSSIGLDYFYANKPLFILDTQDDYWDNFDDRISYQSGVFGKVSRTVDELVDMVILELEGDQALDPSTVDFRNKFYQKTELGNNISRNILEEFNILQNKQN